MRRLMLPLLLVSTVSPQVLADPAQPAARPPLQLRLVERAIAANVSDPEVSSPLPPGPPAESSRATTIFGLPKNMGPIDRIARATIGTALLGLGIWGLSSTEHLSDGASIALISVSAIPFATAATGYCPLYQLFGVDYSF